MYGAQCAHPIRDRCTSERGHGIFGGRSVVTVFWRPRAALRCRLFVLRDVLVSDAGRLGREKKGRGACAEVDAVRRGEVGCRSLDMPLL